MRWRESKWTGTDSPYWAAKLQRGSGLLLALFLPAHFWVLGLALEESAAFDGFLAWSQHPLAKLGEMGLVMLLAAHLVGGLRILMIEFLPWRDWQKSLAALTGGAALVAGLAFLMGAFA